MRSDLGKRFLAIVAGTVLALAAGTYALLAASLPRRGGEAALQGLASPATVELDARAVPRIRGASLEDVFRAQGFVHAQERFFQMDLTRRSAAGELAALVGPRAAQVDRLQRRFEFRERAKALLARLPAHQLAWLAAYAEGVNEGLADLGARPPEYWLLGAPPERWTVEDSALVMFSLYTTLSNNDSFEKAQGVMHATLAPEVYDFLTPSTSRFDRPLRSLPGDDATAGYVPAPVPPAGVVDVSGAPMPGLSTPDGQPRIDPPRNGAASNQWAVDATRGARGAAILANDPHLPMRLPNVFYRCELYWPGNAARGVSIPGLPGILIGATEALAWGTTVSNADQADWVVVEIDPDDPERYLTPSGSEPFRTDVREIAVRGRAAETMEIRSTRWGPTVDRDWLGRPLALHATWLAPDGVDLGLLELMSAKSAAEGVSVLKRWAGPSLNWVLADDAGRIAWIVNGPLPARAGFDGSRPESWADGTRAWHGVLQPPALLGRADGALFTANNRTLPRREAAVLSRVWMRPFRAKRIDELLSAKDRFDENDFLAMQLDTRAEAYEQIRDLVLETVPGSETDPLLKAARAHVAAWNGRADPDQTGFRILQVYYGALLQHVLAPLLAPVFDADPAFVYRWPLADEPLRRVLEERPAHLLTREFPDWSTFLRSVLRDALDELDRDASRPGADASWGDVNRLDVRHPLAGVPILGRWLRLPADPLPGSTVSVRVAAPNYGALFRMTVSPARPADGFLEMAGGQSGHFLSPSFADMQSDWTAGAPTPFLAGATVFEYTLRPRR